MCSRLGISHPLTGGACRIVVTADDFGRSAEVNEAIVRAYRDGILTAASLMVTGDALEEAVALARETPGLAVGLHLVLVDGRALLPRRDIPHLVDSTGQFSRDPLRAGLRYFFNVEARQELRREVRAQFARYAATGLPLTHVDGHLHLHLHPAVLPMLIRLAKRYGARAVRVPRDRLLLALRRGDRRHAATKVFWAAAFLFLAPWCSRQLARHGLATPSRTFGFFQSGNMHVSYVLDLLRRVREPWTEIYFHPTSGERMNAFGPNPDDLQSLVSPAVRQAAEQCRLELSSYAMLDGDGGDGGPAPFVPAAQRALRTPGAFAPFPADKP